MKNDHTPIRTTLSLLLAALLTTGPTAMAAEEEKSPEVAGPPTEAAPPEAAPSTRKNVLTLDECLKRALARSKQLEAEKSRLDVLSEKQDQLWWLPFSNLYLEGGLGILPDKDGYISTDGRVLADDEYEWRDKEWGPSFHVKFGGTLPIPTSNRFFKGLEALDEAYKAKRAMLPTIEHKIAFDVHRAYHGVIGAREMLYTLSQGRKHLTKARKKVEENLAKQEGEDTQIDLLKLKVFESRLDAMETQVKQIEKTALAGLNFLVGAKEGESIDLPDEPQDLVQAEIRELEAYKKEAVEKRPEFEALRHGIKAIRAKISTTKTAFVPEVGIFFKFQAGYTPGVTVEEHRIVVDDNGNATYDPEGRPETEPTGRDANKSFLLNNRYNYGSIIPAFGLVMRVPLDFGVGVHKVREAKAELNALMSDKAYAMNGILLEVETAYIEVTSLLETIDALQKSKKIAKGWLNAAAQNHAVGVGSTKELKDALKEYFTIMGELHQRIGEYNIAVAKLDKATGVILQK